MSPHHASKGSQYVRTLLWRDYGICGTREKIVFRETVCALIRYHMLPVHLIEHDKPELKTRATAAVGELAGDFSWKLLCMLAEADIKGRIAEDTESGVEKIRLTEMLADDTGCFDKPYSFANSFTKRAYLSGRNIQPDQRLYDNTWGEVTMLSGLPGTGKDTWILNNCPDIPMISLDEIRAEYHIKAVGDQSEVIRIAQKRARELLRKEQEFVWNATDLSKDIRQKWINLFEQYGARVRIIYLETDNETRKSRNAGRTAAVPENAVARMLIKTFPPMPDEAQTVEWVCV